MKKQLPDKVGGLTVERHHVAYLSEESDASHPKGVMHTTEGSFESAHAEFLTHFAPNALLGHDASGKIRLVEYAPVGVMSNALEHPSGTPETNRVCVYQIETAAFSQKDSDPLLSPTKAPMDPEFRKALAALMKDVELLGKVPLKHSGDGTRSLINWSKAGWFGHSEVPNNSHWDPGGLRWTKLFALAVPPWKLVKDGKVYARGTLKGLSLWLRGHWRKVRKLRRLNLRRA